jgi:hypothetical protein
MRPLVKDAAGAAALAEPAGLPAARAVVPEGWIRAQATRAQRFAGGSAADRAVLPATHAPGPSLLACRAPGSPVTLDISPGARRPQIEHVSALTGRHAGHSGPSGVRTLTGRRRSQPVHVYCLAGSVIRHLGTTVCRGRRGWRLPERLRRASRARHGTGTEPGHAVAAQPQPVTGLTRGITRPQCGQRGRRCRSRPRRRDRRSAAAPRGPVPGPLLR